MIWGKQDNDKCDVACEDRSSPHSCGGNGFVLLYDIPEPNTEPEPTPSLQLTVDGSSDLLGCYPFEENDPILDGPFRRRGKMTNEVGIYFICTFHEDNLLVLYVTVDSELSVQRHVVQVYSTHVVGSCTRSGCQLEGGRQSCFHRGASSSVYFAMSSRVPPFHSIVDEVDVSARETCR